MEQQCWTTQSQRAHAVMPAVRHPLERMGQVRMAHERSPRNSTRRKPTVTRPNDWVHQQRVSQRHRGLTEVYCL